MFSLRSPALRPAVSLDTFRPLKPLWSGGKELFSEESVLMLSVDVPNIVLSDMPTLSPIKTVSEIEADIPYIG